MQNLMEYCKVSRGKSHLSYSRILQRARHCVHLSYGWAPKLQLVGRAAPALLPFLQLDNLLQETDYDGMFHFECSDTLIISIPI